MAKPHRSRALPRLNVVGPSEAASDVKEAAPLDGHELSEAHALLASEQRVRRCRHPGERERILTHSALAEDGISLSSRLSTGAAAASVPRGLGTSSIDIPLGDHGTASRPAADARLAGDGRPQLNQRLRSLWRRSETARPTSWSTMRRSAARSRRDRILVLLARPLSPDCGPDHLPSQAIRSKLVRCLPGDCCRPLCRRG